MLVGTLFSSLSLLSLTSAAAWAPSPPDGDLRLRNRKYPKTEIESGVLQGYQVNLPNSVGPVNKWLGIPFAKPPKRFSPPERADKDSGVRDATAFKPSCIQQFISPANEYLFNRPPPEESEDCLYLNVFAPASAAAPGNGRPVLFWIYGGALQFGHAGLPMYNGTAIAAYEDVVVVTANYRTNVFGFPSSPELNATQRNLGFLDQRAALQWVQRNIETFGGDPKKVTIFGESAGAWSVDALLTSYANGTEPPFRGAIMQSGQYSYNTQPSVDQTATWNTLAKALNCPRTRWGNSALECLRQADANTIRNVISNSSLIFWPVVDNVTLIANPAKARREGRIANIPVMAGTNSGEGRVVVIGQGDVRAFVNSTIGGNSTDTIVAAYGNDTARSSYDVISDIFTDYYFQCPAAALLDDSVTGGIPAWRYYYNATFSNNQVLPNLGAYHTAEIPILFHTYANASSTVQQYALSNYMSATWARFARNPRGGPGWNTVGTGSFDEILAGNDGLSTGGVYIRNGSAVANGTWNVAVLGDYRGIRGTQMIARTGDVDLRCNLYQDSYNTARQG